MPEISPDYRELFRTVIRSTKEEVLNILGEPQNITSISVPQYFNDSSMGMIFKCRLDIENSFRYWQVKKQFYVGRFAYGFNSCEGFGLYPKNCNVENDVPPIIFARISTDYAGRGGGVHIRGLG